MTSIALAAIMSGILLSGGSLAQQPLTADQVLDKYMEAVGGAAKLSAVSTLYDRTDITGDLESVPMYRAPTGPKSHGTGQAYFKAPLLRISWVRNDKNVVVSALGCDGNDFWVYTPRIGMQKRKVTTEHEYSCEAGMTLLPTQLRRENAKLEMRGQKEVAGRTTFVIHADAPGHPPLTFYMDSANYLLLRVDSKIGKASVTHLYSDYRDVAGIKLPFHIERRSDNTDQIIKVQHVEVNEPLDDKVFQRPNW